MKKRYRIQFPSTDIRELSQDEVYFYLLDGEERTKIRLHEYEKIYRMPGLYEQVVYENAIRNHLDHDRIIVHDPQPLPIIQHYQKKGPWIWRCHVDLSDPNQTLWDYLSQFIEQYDAVIVSLEEYAQRLETPQTFFMPAIDPFSLTPEEKLAVLIAADAEMAHVLGVRVRRSNLTFIKERKWFANTEGAFTEQTVCETGGGIQAIAVGGGEVQSRSYPSSFGRQQITAVDVVFCQAHDGNHLRREKYVSILGDSSYAVIGRPGSLEAGDLGGTHTLFGDRYVVLLDKILDFGKLLRVFFGQVQHFSEALLLGDPLPGFVVSSGFNFL